MYRRYYSRFSFKFVFAFTEIDRDGRFKRCVECARGFRSYARERMHVYVMCECCVCVAQLSAYFIDPVIRVSHSVGRDPFTWNGSFDFFHQKFIFSCSESNLVVAVIDWFSNRVLFGRTKACSVMLKIIIQSNNCVLRKKK